MLYRLPLSPWKSTISYFPLFIFELDLSTCFRLIVNLRADRISFTMSAYDEEPALVEAGRRKRCNKGFVSSL